MAPAQSELAAPELVEGWLPGAPRPVTVAVEPLARMRSPLMDPRRIDPPPSSHEGQTIALPPLRELMEPSAIAIVIAAPVLVLAGWQLALIAGLGATILREVERRMPASSSFAAGFLPYQAEDAWPRGVREDDDVRWNWSKAQPGRGA